MDHNPKFLLTYYYTVRMNLDKSKRRQFCDWTKRTLEQNAKTSSTLFTKYCLKNTTKLDGTLRCAQISGVRSDNEVKVLFVFVCVSGYLYLTK